MQAFCPNFRSESALPGLVPGIHVLSQPRWPRRRRGWPDQVRPRETLWLRKVAVSQPAPIPRTALRLRGNDEQRADFTRFISGQAQGPQSVILSISEAYGSSAISSVRRGTSRGSTSRLIAKAQTKFGARYGRSPTKLASRRGADRPAMAREPLPRRATWPP